MSHRVITFDTGRRSLEFRAHMQLSPQESRVLSYLAKRPQSISNRQQIVEMIDPDVSMMSAEDRLTGIVSKLNAKTRGAGIGNLVRTVRGAGYMLTDNVELQISNWVRLDEPAIRVVKRLIQEVRINRPALAETAQQLVFG